MVRLAVAFWFCIAVRVGPFESVEAVASPRKNSVGRREQFVVTRFSEIDKALKNGTQCPDNLAGCEEFSRLVAIILANQPQEQDLVGTETPRPIDIYAVTADQDGRPAMGRRVEYPIDEYGTDEEDEDDEDSAAEAEENAATEARAPIVVAESLAAEGPIFVVAWDIDETLLQCEVRPKPSCRANPEAFQTVENIQSMIGERKTRVHSQIVVSNGTSTPTKFRLAGFPEAEALFAKSLERPFAEARSPAFLMKDLVALRSELFEKYPEEYPPEVADRVVMVLVDDKGMQYQLYNVCHKEHTGVLSIPIEPFDPFIPRERHSLMTRIEEIPNLLAGYMAAAGGRLASLTVDETAAELGRHFVKNFLHTRPADWFSSRRLLPEGSLMPNNAEPNDMSVATGIFGVPTFLCPYEQKVVNDLSLADRKNVIYPLVVTDAAWMLDVVRDHIAAASKREGAEASSPERLKAEGVLALAELLAPTVPLLSAFFVRCNFKDPPFSGGKRVGTYMGCEELQSMLIHSWEMLRVAPPPTKFSYEASHRYFMNDRNYDTLPLLKEQLGLPEHRTLTIVLDRARHPSQNPSFQEGVPGNGELGFLKLQPFRGGSSRHRCVGSGETPYNRNFEFQFLLPYQSGDDPRKPAPLSNLYSTVGTLTMLLRHVTTPFEVSENRRLTSPVEAASGCTDCKPAKRSRKLRGLSRSAGGVPPGEAPVEVVTSRGDAEFLGREGGHGDEVRRRRFLSKLDPEVQRGVQAAIARRVKNLERHAERVFSRGSVGRHVSCKQDIARENQVRPPVLIPFFYEYGR